MKGSRVVKLAIAGMTVLGTVKTALADVQYSFSPINIPGANATVPQGINDLDQNVGLGDDAFLYSGGSFTTFSFPGGTQTEAHGINDSGQIVGRFMVPIPNSGGGFGLTNQGFLESGGTFTTIDNPGNPDNTYLWGINNSSQIVGSFLAPGPFPNGFLATPMVVPEPRSLPVLAGRLIALLALARYRIGVNPRVPSREHES